MPKYRRPYTIYKRGKYYYYKTYRPDGTHTAGKSTGKTSKSAAREFCDHLYLLGDLYHTEILFKDYAAHFFDDDGVYFSNAIKTYSINTKLSYRTTLKNIVFPYFQNYKLHEIRYSLITAFRAFLLKKYSNQSVNGGLNVLRLILQYAYKDGIIKENPFSFLDSLPQTTIKRDAFSLEEIKKLYTISKEEYKNAILCLALCGLRISEYFGIPYNEIKTGEKNGIKYEYIDLKLQCNSHGVSPVKLNSTREIPIIPEVKQLIGLSPSCYSTWCSLFREQLKNFDNYENRKLCFHSIRHFFITNAKAEGIPPMKVEYIAGHKLKGIEKVYTNLKADDCLEILEWQKNIFAKIKG